jgi:hypothetical protein
LWRGSTLGSHWPPPLRLGDRHLGSDTPTSRDAAVPEHHPRGVAKDAAWRLGTPPAVEGGRRVKSERFTHPSGCPASAKATAGLAGALRA